ncbi:MAG TPA: MmcQ/YjbR family DNA-binding protein [Bryobacteraceae bacterium]|nr:MmcQ/YjbR family DNA-binding protein [Bryobacteraceae bacterium]
MRAARRTNNTRRIGTGPLRSWDAVAHFLLATFPGCEKGTDREVVRVAGKALAYLAANERSRPSGLPANEEFLIVRIDFERREQLLESNPDVFFVTPHYQTYRGVIVRLSTVDQKQLRDLLIEGWRLMAPKQLVREWDADRS